MFDNIINHPGHAALGAVIGQVIVPFPIVGALIGAEIGAHVGKVRAEEAAKKEKK